MLNTLAAGVLCTALILILRSLYLVFLHPLSGYPGPKLWAATRLPWAYHMIKGDLWPVLDKLHDAYGPVIRIAPDELTYTHAQAWREIYNAKPDLLKDPYSQTPPLNGADSLFTAGGANHQRIRGAFVHAFSDKALTEQSTIIEPYATQCIERLCKEMHRSESGDVDLQKVFGYATFDIISDLAWGEAPGALQCSSEEQDWNQKFFLHAQFSTVRNCLSRFWPLDRILQFVFLRITAPQRAANNKLTWERINRRLTLGPSRPDFMTPVLGRIREGGPKGITKSEVLTNGVAVVVANSQLSTIALTAAVYFLLRNPITYQRLVDEIRGEKAFSEEQDMSIASTARLPYLQAVINEALRLHHPTPGSLPRVAPEGGMVVDGRSVPARTIVGVSLLNIHTRPENFNRPREFHPERFLDPSDPRYDVDFSHDNLEAFKPFSTGPRNCIGSRLFLAEARILLARTLWAFDLTLTDVNAAEWLDQKAWLVYEPRALQVRLKRTSRHEQ